MLLQAASLFRAAQFPLSFARLRATRGYLLLRDFLICLRVPRCSPELRQAYVRCCIPPVRRVAVRDTPDAFFAVLARPANGAFLAEPAAPGPVERGTLLLGARL